LNYDAQSITHQGETESLITVAQNQALNMHYDHRNIMKQQIYSKCRMCYKAEEHKT